MKQYFTSVDGEPPDYRNIVNSKKFALQQAKAIAVMKLCKKKVMVYEIVHVPLYEVTSKVKGHGGMIDPSPEEATVKNLEPTAGLEPAVTKRDQRPV